MAEWIPNSPSHKPHLISLPYRIDQQSRYDSEDGGIR